MIRAKILAVVALAAILVFVIGADYSDKSYPSIAGKPHETTSGKYLEIYGHRGARSYAPENTIPSYKVALNTGVNWVDMDVVMTQDGEIIVSHDLWLNPDIVSKKGNFWAKSIKGFLEAAPKDKMNERIEPFLVKNMTLKELQEYEVGIINPSSPYAKYFPNQVAVAGTHIPKLQEVIDYVNKASSDKVNFNIEVKNDPSNPTWTYPPKELAAKLYALLTKNNIIKRAEIQSFDWEVLYELQQLDKNIKTAYLIARGDKERMLSSNIKEAGLWSGGKLLKDYNGSLPQMIKALGGSCYEPEDVALTKEDLEEAHRLGLKVVVWTWPEASGSAFNPNLINKLIDWGVDGILTDDPGQLNSILIARGYPVPKRYSIK